VTGPKVAALGGGHGLAATLQAARRYAGDITAVVSVADDGGSSGRLRDALGIPAPGDLRRCLVALADPETLWAQAFEHRFEAGELAGHALGNLVIAGLAGVTSDFTVALDEAARLLGVHGRVLPATKGPVVLKAIGGDGEVQGQVAVQNAGRIRAVSLVPADAEAPPEVVDAILAADQVVIGPGSLFTSILAVIAVPDIRRALAETAARKVYVANLREQHPETEGLDVAGHLSALSTHGLEVDVVVCHRGGLPVGLVDVPTVERSIAPADLSAHDPGQLAEALADLVG
jgi:uncharacterized cofD-like protein